MIRLHKSQDQIRKLFLPPTPSDYVANISAVINFYLKAEKHRVLKQREARQMKNERGARETAIKKLENICSITTSEDEKFFFLFSLQ